MMKKPILADSHCHLDMLDLSLFEGSLENVFRHAHDEWVEYFLCVAVTPTQHDVLLDIANRFENVSLSVGSHPNNPKEESISLETLLDLAKIPKVVAIGETGLDYYRSHGDLRWQQERFEVHIEAAKRCHKPLIVHSREAKHDTISILKTHQNDAIEGVFHCFAGDWEMAKFGLDLGFYISFSGVVTFKNATLLQEIAKQVPLDRMLIETDCPYLAPVPFRGKPNCPGYVRYVAEFIAFLKQKTFEEVAAQTTQNYLTLFHKSG